jgi:hypothetical protein
VIAWRDSLLLAGQNLTAAQLKELNTVAIDEGRLETEERLALAEKERTTGMDNETVFRMREENLNRTNETNQRILQRISPQLSEAQAQALREVFRSGHEARLSALHEERDRKLKGAR